jgi:hypothetical protein
MTCPRKLESQNERIGLVEIGSLAEVSAEGSVLVKIFLGSCRSEVEAFTNCGVSF